MTSRRRRPSAGRGRRASPARGAPARPDEDGGRSPGGYLGASRWPLVTDPLTGTLAEERAIQPYQALKFYRCPGCNQQVAPGIGHVVVVPLSEPGERRHWHRACWSRRDRRPGR